MRQSGPVGLRHIRLRADLSPRARQALERTSEEYERLRPLREPVQTHLMSGNVEPMTPARTDVDLLTNTASNSPGTFDDVPAVDKVTGSSDFQNMGSKRPATSRLRKPAV